MLTFAAITRLARKDARRESASERAPFMPRESGRLLVEVNGQRFDLTLLPDRRDCRLWIAVRDGQPWERGGLECIWRRVQSELAPRLSERAC